MHRIMGFRQPGHDAHRLGCGRRPKRRLWSPTRARQRSQRQLRHAHPGAQLPLYVFLSAMPCCCHERAVCHCLYPLLLP